MLDNQTRRKLLAGVGTAALGVGTLSGTGAADMDNCEGSSEISSGGTVQGMYIPLQSDTLDLSIENQGSQEMTVEYWVGTIDDREEKASEVTIPSGLSFNRPINDLIPQEHVWIVAEGSSGTVEWTVYGGRCF